MDDPNFVMFGLDRWDLPAPSVVDFADDTGCTFPFLTMAYETSQDYDNTMKYWVVDPDGLIAYESGVHEQDIPAQQTAIEAALSTLDVDEPATREQPSEFVLLNAYPNPFNSSVTVSMELPASESVRVSVLDLLGREVAVLVNERRSAGNTELSWTPANLATGVYLLRVQGESFAVTRKLMYLK
ncbi:T9SS type A sorting domain-containing protein [bacterium]|nr:T9SS type A sorting domain-containing protein [bacterium]